MSTRTTKVLAFDQATSSGWAFQDGDQKPIYGHFRAPKREDVGERLAFIYDRAGELMDRFEPTLVAHEKPFFPVQRGGPVKPTDDQEPPKGATFNVATISFLHKVEGVIQLQAARRGIAVESYGSRSWPPTILGRSAFKGEDVKAAVRSRCRTLGHNPETLDESDAIGILYHALYGAPAAKRAQGDLLAMAAARL